MVTTTQVTTARSARAFEECLLPEEAPQVEFTKVNCDQTKVTFSLSAVAAYDLVVKVMERIAAERGRRGYPHQSIHYLRTHLWWLLSDSQRERRMGRKNATKGRARRS